MKKEPRPSKFDVAMEKGDYQLPSDVPVKSDPFEDFLEGLITGYEWLDCPDNKTWHRLGKWKDHNRNRKETAFALGMTRDGFDKWMERLKQTYERHKSCFIQR